MSPWTIRWLHRHRGLVLVGLAGTVLLCIISFAALFGGPIATLGQAQAACTSGGEASLPTGEPPLMQYYHAAAVKHGLGEDGYAYLAAINDKESTFGASTSPGVPEGTKNPNPPYAEGPMEFTPSTWETYGEAIGHPPPPDVHNPQDAIYSAARLLKADGAPEAWHEAIESYNGGTTRNGETKAYAAQVESWAHSWEGAAGEHRLENAIAAAWAGRKPELPTPVSPGETGSSNEGCCPEASVTLTTEAAPSEHGGYGFTPAPGANFEVNLEANIAKRLDILGRTDHLKIWGATGYTTPRGTASKGATAAAFTRGAAIAIVLGSEGAPSRSAAKVSNAQLASVGLLRPFDRSDNPSGAAVNIVEIGETVTGPHGEKRLRPLPLEGPAISTPAEAPASPTPEPPPIPGHPAESSAPAAASGTCIAPISGECVEDAKMAVIRKNGDAVPPCDAPRAVKAMIAAGNRINHFPYSYGGGHGAPAQTMSQTEPDPAAVPGREENGGPGYDCSSSTSYVLWGGGFGKSVLGGGVYASTELETVGEAGKGKWVTWYANAEHAYIEVAGIYLDTAAGLGNPPNPPSTGPRWTPEGTGPTGFVARHLPVAWDG